MNPRDWLPANSALTFAQPWLLLILLLLPLLAYLRGKSGPAAALTFSSTSTLRSLGRMSAARTLGTAFVKKFTEERELMVILVVDVSASGNFGSAGQSKRELAAEVACLLAFSAIRNNDKVGLLLFSDRVELFIPPKKGRSHTLRIIREILFFEPAGRGTIPALALDYLNKVITRRAVVFFVSDFQTGDFSRELSVTGRRHDCIAVHIQDQREEYLPNVGIIMLEDAETGEQIEINTADRETRERFGALAEANRAELNRTLRRNSIDAISLRTGEDYLPALRSFFKQRERRLAVR